MKAVLLFLLCCLSSVISFQLGRMDKGGRLLQQSSRLWLAGRTSVPSSSSGGGKAKSPQRKIGENAYKRKEGERTGMNNRVGTSAGGGGGGGGAVSSGSGSEDGGGERSSRGGGSSRGGSSRGGAGGRGRSSGGGGRRGGGGDGGDRTFVPLGTRWRMFNVEVLLADDPGKDSVGVHEALIDSIARDLKLDQKDRDSLCAAALEASSIEADSDEEFQVKVIKKSFDGRYKKTGQPKFVYTVDVSLPLSVCKVLKIRPIEARRELAPDDEDIPEVQSCPEPKNGRVVVVGAGPAGLFAAYELARAGLRPLLIERGQPVERRGRDIGALFNRKILDGESNLCYGEGGAGTWSDGKLTTRIGKNSDEVRRVLQTLVDHGAPERILVDGKPHLGTDRLVRILRSLRAALVEMGCEFQFGVKVTDLVLEGQEDKNEGAAAAKVEGKAKTKTPRGKLLKRLGVEVAASESLASHSAFSPASVGVNTRRVVGVRIADSSGVESTIPASLVCLAVGHSARALYERLVDHGVTLEPKPIAVGFRVEHPQALINKIQYGQFGDLCGRGTGPVPVADYRLAEEVMVDEEGGGEGDNAGAGAGTGGDSSSTKRAVYSFCMCPGGQIVPTSVKGDELCLNGMSFSKRQSEWANSALVVGVQPSDMLELGGSGPLRGVVWQEEMERRAARMGGGNLVAPVQRVTDFLAGIPTEVKEGEPPLRSSYRMGVKGAACHELYPPFVTEALRKALLAFDRRMPGFISPDAILHGVETRTSAPVQILRSSENSECATMGGMFPAGEGAGYAGGIVSAAVDGMRVGTNMVRAARAMV